MNYLDMNHYCIGFDYQFNSLNVHGEPNALNTAMNTLFDASASVDVFLILQALFPILNRIVSITRNR